MHLMKTPKANDVAGWQAFYRQMIENIDWDTQLVGIAEYEIDDPNESTEGMLTHARRFRYTREQLLEQVEKWQKHIGAAPEITVYRPERDYILELNTLNVRGITFTAYMDYFDCKREDDWWDTPETVMQAPSVKKLIRKLDAHIINSQHKGLEAAHECFEGRGLKAYMEFTAMCKTILSQPEK